jgi:hypothetical protein
MLYPLPYQGGGLKKTILKEKKMKNYKDFTSELADIIPYIEKQDGEKILICDSDDPKSWT